MERGVITIPRLENNQPIVLRARQLRSVKARELTSDNNRISFEMPDEDLLNYALYWDKIVTTGLSINGAKAISLLNDGDCYGTLAHESVICEVDVGIHVDNIDTDYVSYTDCFLWAQENILAELNKDEDILWSLGQTGPSFITPDGKGASRDLLEIKLFNSLPRIHPSSSIHEVLRFRDKRKEELVALRHHMDALRKAVLASEDKATEAKRSVEKLEVSLNNLTRALGESRLRVFFQSLSLYLSAKENAFVNALFAGLGAASAHGFEMPVAVGAALGLGLNTALTFASRNRELVLPEKCRDFAYLYHARKQHLIGE